jgi:hypothetical protein
MDVHDWYVERLVSRTIKALEANFFKAAFFTSRESLLESVVSNLTPKMTVGIGGSVTLREMGLIDRLQKEDVTVLDHWRPGLTPQEIQSFRIKQLTSDLFISSTNAITEKGEVVNIDGAGNRVGGMTFGPKKVLVIAGYNKIVPDVEAALDRIRRIAAPMNAKRLNMNLPCAETGTCHDCKSEARICRIVSILQRRPNLTDISLLILNEPLGY